MKTISAVAVAVVIGLAIPVAVRAASQDSKIEQAAKTSYVFKTYLKADHVRVLSHDGMVTLTGTVSSDSHRFLAENTVRALPGVKGVDDRIEVQGEQAKGSASQPSDDWITAKVKTSLLIHPSVSGLKTEVATKDGIVTLRGTANSESQKELTTQYAQDIRGVRRVDNELEVLQPTGSFGETPMHTSHRATTEQAGNAIDDASVTAQIKLALLLHHSTSALRTEVTTDHGVVSLHGTVKDQAEKDLVTKLSRDISGVSRVNNEMTIGG